MKWTKDKVRERIEKYFYRFNPRLGTLFVAAWSNRLAGLFMQMIREERKDERA